MVKLGYQYVNVNSQDNLSRNVIIMEILENILLSNRDCLQIWENLQQEKLILHSCSHRIILYQNDHFKIMQDVIIHEFSIVAW